MELFDVQVDYLPENQLYCRGHNIKDNDYLGND
jgi:hypothetical protein